MRLGLLEKLAITREKTFTLLFYGGGIKEPVFLSSMLEGIVMIPVRCSAMC